MIKPMLITRRPGQDFNDAQLTYIARSPISCDLAMQQHSSYRAALALYASDLIDMPALPGHPDCPFVEDMLIALPEMFILCRSGALSRRGEVASIAAILPSDRAHHVIDAPATIDGGDVLVIGRSIFVGLSTRTNADGIAALSGLTAPFGYTVSGVSTDKSLHLKTAVTSPAPNLILINADWVNPTPFGGYTKIQTAVDEPFSANSLMIGEAIFVQSSHPKMQRNLTARGYNVAALNISEFAKAEAGLTCLSVIIPDCV